MKKLLSFFLLIFLSNSCSFNPNSNFWNEDPIKVNNNNQNNNFKESSGEIQDSSYKLLKDRIIEYGKNKDFPDINN